MTVTLINDKDVLFGRGKNSTLHVGNVSFRALIESRFDKYNEFNVRAKRGRLFVEITDLVLQSGARFLRKAAHGTWEDVDVDVARLKVAQHFRDAVKLRKKNPHRCGSEFPDDFVEKLKHQSYEEIVSVISSSHFAPPRARRPEVQGMCYDSSAPQGTSSRSTFDFYDDGQARITASAAKGHGGDSSAPQFSTATSLKKVLESVEHSTIIQPRPLTAYGASSSVTNGRDNNSDILRPLPHDTVEVDYDLILKAFARVQALVSIELTDEEEQRQRTHANQPAVEESLEAWSEITDLLSF